MNEASTACHLDQLNDWHNELLACAELASHCQCTCMQPMLHCVLCVTHTAQLLCDSTAAHPKCNNTTWHAWLRVPECGNQDMLQKACHSTTYCWHVYYVLMPDSRCTVWCTSGVTGVMPQALSAPHGLLLALTAVLTAACRGWQKLHVHHCPGHQQWLHYSLRWQQERGVWWAK